MKLHEDNWLYERSVTTRDQHKSFKFLLLSNVVDNFLCHCDSRYIGCTSQRLQDRICQHMPKFIRTGQIPNSHNISTHSGKSSTPVMFSDSAIGQHLLDTLFASKITGMKNLQFFHLVVRLFVYLLWKPFTSNHASQIYAAKKSLFTT